MFLALMIYTTIKLLVLLTYVNVNLELFIADCKGEGSWQGE